MEDVYVFFIWWFSGIMIEDELDDYFVLCLDECLIFVFFDVNYFDWIGLFVMFGGVLGFNLLFKVEIWDVMFVYDFGDYVVVMYMEW